MLKITKCNVCKSCRFCLVIVKTKYRSVIIVSGLVNTSFCTYFWQYEMYDFYLFNINGYIVFWHMYFYMLVWYMIHQMRPWCYQLQYKVWYSWMMLLNFSTVKMWFTVPNCKNVTPLNFSKLTPINLKSRTIYSIFFLWLGRVCNSLCFNLSTLQTK